MRLLRVAVALLARHALQFANLRHFVPLSFRLHVSSLLHTHVSMYPGNKETPNPLTVSRLGALGGSETVPVPSCVDKINATVRALRARGGSVLLPLFGRHLNVPGASAALHVDHFVSLRCAYKGDSMVLT